MGKYVGAESDFKNERIADDFYRCVIEKVEERINERSKSESKIYLLAHVKVDNGTLEGIKYVTPMPCVPTEENKHGKLITAMYGSFEVGKEYDTNDYLGKKVLIFWEWIAKNERMEAKVFKRVQ